MRVATDIGGTFTDLVCFDTQDNGTGSNIKIAKSSTTPGEFEKGILDTIKKAEINLEAVDFFVHGTTVVINAITERKGAKTALITTKGFRDVLELARGTRPDLYNFNFQKQSPFVSRHLRHEVIERINFKGEVIEPLNLSTLEETLLFFKEEKVETIAICLLHAYNNPSHEVQLQKAVEKLAPDMDVICSHSVSREWREYERTNSTVLSAYVKPITTKYLNKLADSLYRLGYKENPYIMQSNGGITTLEDVKQNPIVLIESGPASGMLGGVVLGKAMGKSNLIVLDIGGTTAKCSLIENGALKISTKYNIEKTKTDAGFPILTPVIDLVEIGNGGGSIAWIDAGGKLHVGPQSAGASPGPASYGDGGDKLTTTDANVICNRIHSNHFMGGQRKPDMKAIEIAAAEFSKKLGMTKEEVARGIIRVANSNMINALKSISVNKGYDPRDFSLVVIGGGGPMHGTFLAEELQMPEVIVPINAGVFSAFGMLMSDLRRDYLRTFILPLDKNNIDTILDVFNEMEELSIKEYMSDKYKKEDISFEYHADMRYMGQEHYVKVELEKDVNINSIISDFHKLHQKHYAFTLDDTVVEIVNFHLVAKVAVDKPFIPKMKITGKKIEEALLLKEEVDFDEFGIHESGFYDRADLEPEMIISGPAVIVEQSTSSVIPPHYQVHIDEFSNLIISKK